MDFCCSFFRKKIHVFLIGSTANKCMFLKECFDLQLDKMLPFTKVWHRIGNIDIEFTIINDDRNDCFIELININSCSMIVLLDDDQRSNDYKKPTFRVMMNGCAKTTKTIKDVIVSWENRAEVMNEFTEMINKF